MRKPYQSPGRMINSSYYIAPAGDRTHDLPHTVASNMVKVSYAPNHSVKAAVYNVCTYNYVMLIIMPLRIFLVHNFQEHSERIWRSIMIKPGIKLHHLITTTIISICCQAKSSLRK